MLNGTLDGLGEAIAIEGLQDEGAAVLETSEIETFENKSYISEVDEVRVNETADIMVDVFSEDVLANWSEMSLDEKSEKLNEYYIKAGENLGIDTKGVILEPMEVGYDTIEMGYNSGDGYIHINSLVVEDPSMLGQVLDTATHEMRHQFQSDAVESPNNFSDIPKDVLDVWEYELDPANYIRPEYDLEGYYNQAIERDSRNYAGEVLNAYTEKLNLN